MAEIGRGPLALVGNVVKCGACGDPLPGAAAGGTIDAHHHGPVLVGIRVTVNGRQTHACGTAATNGHRTRRKTTSAA